MDDLLKEAIADAKAVRETALANAKMALEEAFTPRLQSMLSKKIQTELEDDDDEDEEEYAVYQCASLSPFIFCLIVMYKYPRCAEIVMYNCILIAEGRFCNAKLCEK